MRPCSLLAALVLTTGFAGAAAAGQLVIGQTAAAACYKAAEAQNYSNSAFRNCTEALDEDMSQRDRAATHINRGIVAAGGGRIDEAMADYETAIRMRPEIGEGYANRGTIYRTWKNFDAALADFDTALELGVKEPHLVHFNRAVVLEQTGRVKDAYFDYKKAAELAPDWDMPRRELARFTVSETG